MAVHGAGAADRCDPPLVYKRLTSKIVCSLLRLGDKWLAKAQDGSENAVPIPVQRPAANGHGRAVLRPDVTRERAVWRAAPAIGLPARMVTAESPTVRG